MEMHFFPEVILLTLSVLDDRNLIFISRRIQQELLLGVTAAQPRYPLSLGFSARKRRARRLLADTVLTAGILLHLLLLI